jgi:hypothetical protein
MAGAGAHKNEGQKADGDNDDQGAEHDLKDIAAPERNFGKRKSHDHPE